MTDDCNPCQRFEINSTEFNVNALTPAQLTNLLSRFNFSGLTAAQCDAIAACTGQKYLEDEKCYQEPEGIGVSVAGLGANGGDTPGQFFSDADDNDEPSFRWIATEDGAMLAFDFHGTIGGTGTNVFGRVRNITSGVTVNISGSLDPQALGTTPITLPTALDYSVGDELRFHLFFTAVNDVVWRNSVVDPALANFEWVAGGSTGGQAGTNLYAYKVPVPHVVRTYSDGTDSMMIEFANGTPVVLDEIPAEWEPCPPLTAEQLAVIEALADDVTSNIECFNNRLGIYQFDWDGIDVGNLNPPLPTAILIPAASVADGIHGEIQAHFSQGLTFSTVPETITAEIYADGVLVETREDAHIFGGASARFNFGRFEFLSGVDYRILFSTTVPDIVLYGTTNSSSTLATFETPINAGSGVPVMSIEEAGSETFRVVTRTDGTQFAVDDRGDEVPLDLSAWMPCPNTVDAYSVDGLPGLLETLLKEATECLLPVGEAEPLGAAAGLLSDGTVWAGSITSGNGPLTFSAANPGDLRWEDSSTLTFTFDKPTTLILKPTTDPADPDIGDPNIWTTPNSKVTHDGTALYIPGSFNALLDTLADPTQVRSTLAPANAPTASDSWGSVVLTGVTEVALVGQDNEAVRLEAIPLDIMTTCAAIQSLLDAQVQECCAPDFTSLQPYADFQADANPGGIGSMIDVGDIVVTPAAGQPTTTRVNYQGPCGIVPVDIRVERLAGSPGGGTVTINTAVSRIGYFDNADFKTTARLAPVLGVTPPAPDWSLHAGSFGGGGERLVLADFYPDDYIAGPGAQADGFSQAQWDASPKTGGFAGESLPLNWSNNNNPGRSGFRFDGVDEISWTNFQNDNLSDTVGLMLVTGPSARLLSICDSIAEIRSLINARPTASTEEYATVTPVPLPDPQKLGPVFGDHVTQVFNDGLVLSTYDGTAWTNTAVMLDETAPPVGSHTSEGAYTLVPADLQVSSGHKTILVSTSLGAIPAGVFPANGMVERQVRIVNVTGAPMTISAGPGVTLISNGNLTIQDGESIELVSTETADTLVVLGGTS